MKNKRFLSVLLCLALLASLPVLPGGAAAADDAPGSGMKISKTATANADGSYTITLEAYATGSKVTTTVNKDIPTDIILVLDQSGSMEKPIGGYEYTKYRKSSGWSDRNYHNDEYYPLRHNGGSENLWHKLSEDEYVAVSVVQETDYTPVSGWNNREYYDNQKNLYYRLVSGEYKSVVVEREGHLFSADEYWYSVDGQQILYATGDDSIPNFGQYAPLYQSVKKYTYSYTLNGATTVIEESVGDGSSPNTQFYEKGGYSSSAGGTRLNALKSAVNQFADEVAKKAKGADGQYGGGDDVDHRVAVVGFSSDATNLTNGFVEMKTADGLTKVNRVVNNLSASGDTYPAKGLDIANTILKNAPVPDDQERNRVIVLFTDGYPAESGTDNINYTLCDNAIASAYTSKKTYGATVYTVGIFSGADPTSDIDTNFEYGNRRDAAKQLVAANRYMHYTSTNFENARSMQNGGAKNHNGYYLSADNADSLNNIFQKISNNITTGGSSTTLGSETVIKDIISPSFVLKEGNVSDIALETYACTGVDENGNRIFAETKNKDSLGERVELISSKDNVSEDNPKVPDQVNVTGFDFSANWCGVENNNGTITPHGNKLVIKITVKPRPGFFGGNGVTTNTSAGVYENETAEQPTFTFDQPKVDVPLATVVVEAPEANVYLGAHLNETVDKDKILQDGAQVTIGGCELDFAQGETGNYGLEDWQNAYVNIDTKVTTSGNLTNMTEDAGYTVTVKVTPKTPEGAKGIEDFATGTIHVFKPELTFKDSEVKYMVDTVTNPKYFIANNKVGDEVWKNGGRTDTSDGVTMLTNKPTLALTYTPASGALRAEDGLVISPDDIPVAVTVGINGNNVTQYTTFVHQACNPVCDWTNPTTPGNPAFRLHVKDVYADLTITKRGANETADPGQSFLFTVTGPDNYSTEVIIVGNGSVTLKNLKIGTYTVTENTGWSWRYTPINNGQKITLAANGNNEVTINNRRDKDQWLDGNVHADNVFTGTTD